MSKTSALKGLYYKKLDLHIHTPASTCFLGDATPEEIVRKALDAGLDGIAITDHNTAKSIDAVKAVASSTSLIVFPGVEISCSGGRKNIHVIALLDPKSTGQDVQIILNLVGIKPAQYGKEDAVTDMAPIEVIKIIDKNHGLAVLAHSNSSGGVLKDMTGQPRTNVIKCRQLLAVEATDFEDETKRVDHKRAVDFLDGTDPTYERKLAVYQASDNPDTSNSGKHSLAGIGTRYSYFKMELINLEALRQCFIDPDMRVRQENELLSLSYPQILKVTCNSGFFDGREANFHSGLTSILGAKGAGKSLLIEFIRFALGQEPTNAGILEDHMSKLRSKLGEYGTVEVTVIDENGKETIIKRTFRELDGSPYDDSVPYDPLQIFPVLFLSQNEIIAIAENEDEQLKFIDRFFDFRTYRAKIATTEKEIEKLDSTMADGLRAFIEVEELNVKIKSLDQEIAKLDVSLNNPIFEKFQEMEKKEKAFRLQQDHIQTFLERIVQTREHIVAMSTPQFSGNLAIDPAIKRNLDLIGKAHETAAVSLAVLSGEVVKTQGKVKQEYQAWLPTYTSGKTEYEQYIQKMGGDYKALALTRDRLVRQRSDYQKQLDGANARKDMVRLVSKKRDELLNALQSDYTAYTEERKAKCNKFMQGSAGKLKLQILDQLNVDKFRESLLSLKRGSYLRDDEIVTITSKISPREFVISLLRYNATKESKHLESVSKDSGIILSRMKILADYLLSAIPYEELLSLQYRAYPQDRPQILYNIGGNNYESISKISVGQKCTATLLMALSDGAMPIVIDQPEDSLDIRSIWEDVCTKVRGGKEKRQFIFTTHNSSVAVASDTDCFLVIEGDATGGRVVYSGSLDHGPVGPEVLKYLEGGPETYQLKFEKYSNHRSVE